MFSLNVVVFPAQSLLPKLAHLIPGYSVLPSAFTACCLLLKSHPLLGKMIRKFILSFLMVLLKSLWFPFAPDRHELVDCIPGHFQASAPIFTDFNGASHCAK